MMGIEVKFTPDPQDQGRVIPAYDVNAILSKMIALFVFSGLSVPSSFAPPYNRVHADVEWWKKYMAEATAEPAAPAAAAETVAAENAENTASAEA